MLIFISGIGVGCMAGVFIMAFVSAGSYEKGYQDAKNRFDK